MKFNLILIIALSFITSCNSSETKDKPNTEETINSTDVNAVFASDLKIYFEAFNAKNWDIVMDMIYPKLFNFLPRDQMMQSFIQMGEMGMEMNINFVKIEKTSEIYESADSKYCRVYYNGSINITVTGEMLESKDELKVSFDETYGAENIIYDATKGQFEINSQKSMLAIYSISADDWYYLEYNANQIEMLRTLIPQDILDQLVN